MAKKVTTPLDVMFEFRLDPGPQPATVVLRLQYRSTADVQNKRPGPLKQVALVMFDEQRQELADALSGKTAATPPPERYDA